MHLLNILFFTFQSYVTGDERLLRREELLARLLLRHHRRHGALHCPDCPDAQTVDCVQVFRLLSIWFEDEETIVAVLHTGFSMEFPYHPQVKI